MIKDILFSLAAGLIISVAEVITSPAVFSQIILDSDEMEVVSEFEAFCDLDFSRPLYIPERTSPVEFSEVFSDSLVVRSNTSVAIGADPLDIMDDPSDGTALFRVSYPEIDLVADQDNSSGPRLIPFAGYQRPQTLDVQVVIRSPEAQPGTYRARHVVYCLINP